MSLRQPLVTPLAAPAAVARYGLALAVVALAYVLQRLVWPFIPPSPHLFFYPAVFVAARLAGARAGYLATVVAAVLIASTFLLPVGVLQIEKQKDVLDLAVFVGVSLGISAAVGQLRAMIAHEHALALQAQEAKRTTEATWSMVAHDLRTPLNVISMGSAALGNGSSVTPEMATLLATIERSSARASVLLDDALDAMRAAEGKLRVEPVACDPSELVARVLDAVGLLASRRGVKLVSDVRGHRAVLGDPLRLEQVLVNLVGNAIKFTPASGTVSLHVEADSEVVRFAVSDTGAGIPEGEQEAIFTKFWSGSASGGAGLGLWIASVILQAHHARLAVESAVGAGTTFRFALPAAALA